MKRSLTNNIGLKLLAFLFAFLLWLIVVNIDDPITSRSYAGIPVTVEHGEIITADQKTYQIVDDTQTVYVTVEAKRSVLNRIKAEDILATADMKELYLESQIPIDVDIPEYANEYVSAVSNPRNLQVEIEDNASMTYSITPVTVGSVRDGYALGEISVNPEKVTINGPKSIINRINKVTATVDVSGLAKDTVLASSLVLYDADNNVIDQSRLGNNLSSLGVDVKVRLLNTKRVSVVVDTSGVTAKEGYSIAEIEHTPWRIQIAGEQSVLDGIDRIYIPAEELNFKEISGKKEKTIDISPYLPEGTRLVDENGKNIYVNISVEKDGTKSFRLPVGSIEIKNLDDAYNMRYNVTDDLDIHVRGPQETLDILNIEKAASIDLKGITEEGIHVVPVAIELPDNCSLENDVEIEIVLEIKSN